MTYIPLQKHLDEATELAGSYFNKADEPEAWAVFYEQFLMALDPNYNRREQTLEEVEEGIRWERECRLKI